MLVSNLVDEVRDHLMGSQSDQLNLLANDVAASETDFTFEDELKGIAAGSILEVGTERMYVRTATPVSKQAKVVRGFTGGGDAAQHTAGSFVRVNPSFPTQALFQAVLDEITSLQGHGLYQFETVEITRTSGDWSDVSDLVLTKTGTPLFIQQALWKYDSDDDWRPANVTLLEGLSTASTYGLQVLTRNRGAAATFRVTVALTLPTPTSLDDDLADLGVDGVVRQAIGYGAAWRMVPRKEMQRVNPDHSHGSRRAEEVEPGAVAFVGRVFESMRSTFIREALDAQHRQWPPRMAP